MRVAIIYNKPKPSAPEEHWLCRSVPAGKSLGADFCDASEVGVLQEAQLIEGFLQEGGYQTVLFAADDPVRLAEFLARDRPDIIFNCCETFQGDPTLEMGVAGLYELLRIPYTGAPALTLGMALNKGIAKTLFRANGIPTPRHVVMDRRIEPEAARELTYPLIVKPLQEDASNGIDAHAVVETEEALLRRVRFIRAEFRQPSLVEEFIDGRELNVAVLAASPEEFIALPVSEILFQQLPGAGPRIVSYEAKWVVDSEAYRSTVPKCPADLPPALEERVRAMALQAARVIGLQDYGRIDLRVRAGDDAVFVLEANPNPDVNVDSGFVRAAEASGRSHASLIREILERAMERAAGEALGKQRQVQDDTTVTRRRS